MNRTADHPFSLGASDPALAHLCDEIIERIQAGDLVDVAAMAVQHPEHADQLRRLLPALEALVELGATAFRHPSALATGKVGSDLAPKFLGDYRIVREVGRGGMGVVYEAQQRSLNRRVALKVLPMAAALDARQFQRFQLEAQAAACLHHNNIVPVFAVGTEGGVPFYAMQYIEGRTLADVIQELRRAEGLEQEPPAREGGAVPRLADVSTTALARSLVTAQACTPQCVGPTEPLNPIPSPLSRGECHGEGQDPEVGRSSKIASSTRTRDYCRNIADLGLQAAEALDHAHTRGILHRDIKPANLLLGAGGRLWVTDFGLAQIQGNHGLTLSGDVLGTLRYMSPEQALGKRIVIDGRTDVYSLGVTLYELLTLQPAFDGKERAEVLRRMQSDEPKSLRKLNASVPHDLETIVEKALAKEPSERYTTAKDLGDDLRRFLEDRPIRARRPGLLDRAAKLSRRHRSLVTTTAFLLVLGTALSTWQAAEARKARRATAAALVQAQNRADETQHVLEYLVKELIGAVNLEAAGRPLTVTELLNKTSTEVGKRFKGQPLLEARFRMALAETHEAMGRYAEADEHATAAWEIRRRLLGPEHADTLASRSLQAGMKAELGCTSAESIAREVFAARRRLLGAAHPDTISSEAVLSYVLCGLERFEDALTLAQEAVALAEANPGVGNRAALYARHHLGCVFLRMGAIEESVASLRVTLEDCETRLGPLHEITLWASDSLGSALVSAGQFDEARRVFEASCERRTRLYGFCSISTSFALDNLQEVLRLQGDLSALRDHYQQWIRGLLETPREADQYIRHRRGFRLASFALSLVTLPPEVPVDNELALRAAREATVLHDRWSDPWSVLGLVHYRLDHLEEAERAIRAAWDRRLDPQQDPLDHLVLTLIHARRGDRRRALAEFELFSKLPKESPSAASRDQLEAEARALLGL
jgi:serine/threonine protein kinase